MTFTPTVDHTSSATGDPSTCWLCNRHAIGVGVGSIRNASQDPNYLCPQCVPLIDYVRSIRNFDKYERLAVERAVDAVGGFLETHGTDLAEWEGETAEQFVRAIWEACGDELREVIKSREVPF